MNTTRKCMTVDEASRIFHLIKGNEVSKIFTTPLLVRIYPAETFALFLLKNQIETYEEVIR